MNTTHGLTSVCKIVKWNELVRARSRICQHGIHVGAYQPYVPLLWFSCVSATMWLSESSSLPLAALTNPFVTPPFSRILHTNTFNYITRINISVGGADECACPRMVP